MTSSSSFLGSLPELLAQTNLSASQMARMSEQCDKLLMYISRNTDKYFRTEYVLAEEVTIDNI